MIFYDEAAIFRDLPLLESSNYRITSNPTIFVSGPGKNSIDNVEYNCIAFAAGDYTKFWWPLNDGYHFWPSACRLEDNLDSFIEMFALLGYKRCKTPNANPLYEKVAIYADGKHVRHVARQSPFFWGRWRSKLGQEADIMHSLEALEGAGSIYGAVVAYMSRPIWKKLLIQASQIQ